MTEPVTPWEKAQAAADPTCRRYGFHHVSFDAARRAEAERDARVARPPTIEDGLLTCCKCRAKQVVSTQIQTRSADEPMTLVALCARCGHGWTQSG